MNYYFRKVCKYTVFCAIWYKLGCINTDDVKNKSYIHGYNISQKFKKYPVWDNQVEPLIIKQFSNIFIVGHAFINGLVSDNDDKKKITKHMSSFYKNIKQDIDTGKYIKQN